MFYKILDNRVYEYANEKFKEEWIETSLCTVEEYDNAPNKYIVGDITIEVDVPDYEEQETENGTQTIQVGSHKETKVIKGLILNPNYEAEQEEERKQTFYSQFLATSLGNFRLQPKGYANAQQAMDVINTMATALGGLTEQLTNLVIFYPTPDFTDAEQCTEEWLVANQIKPDVMTLTEWQKFYLEFCQLYAMQQYKKEVVDEDTTDTESNISNEVEAEETAKSDAN